MGRFDVNQYGFALCRAWILGAKRGGKRLHLCGREETHRGAHQCYCGHRWPRSKGSKLCHTWRPASAKPLKTMQPSGSVTEDKVLELYGKRNMDL